MHHDSYKCLTCGENTGGIFCSQACDRAFRCDYITGKKKLEANVKKRLTKGSERDSKLGGVCSGLGDYFNIDPVFIRIPFAILIFLYAVGLILYFIFWISLPDHPSE